MKQERVRKRF